MPTDPPDEHLGPALTALAMGEPLQNEAELRAHLQACPACQAELQETLQVLEATDALPAPKLSAGFDRALFAKLDALDSTEAHSSASVVSIGARLRRWWVPALGLAAAAVLALWFVRRPSRQSAPPQAGVLELAQDLELYENLEVLEHLDVLEDLELIDQAVEG